MLKITTIVLLLLQLSIGQDFDDDPPAKATVEIELANLELQDDCENLATGYKEAVLYSNFDKKRQVAESHGSLLKVLAGNLRRFESDTPEELLRNLSLFLKSGDGLLREKDWTMLVNFDSYYEQVIHTVKVHCQSLNETNCVFIKNGYEENLENSRNVTLLRRSWLAWQNLMSADSGKFKTILNLAPLAALQNGKENLREYWEMLAEKEGVFDKAEELWEEIKPLYVKLHTYVGKRLFYYYNLTSTSEIPVYLLGSNFGEDWSKISEILIPHPEIFQTAETYIKKKDVRELYQEAEKIMEDLNLGTFGSKFWSNSVFNATFCENNVASFCSDEHTEVFTCDKISWSGYLDAFETSMDVILRKVDYLSLARNNLRYSALIDGLKELGNLIGVKNLHYKKIWNSDLFNEDNRMAELFLIALRTLPKLPFYLVADKWRLDLIENGFDDFNAKWWKLRKEYQGIQGVYTNETDFLGDSHIRTNKPYISKFLGTILQFQIMQYYGVNSINNSLIEDLSHSDFDLLIQKTQSLDWSSILENELEFYGISASPLLDFFAPLMDYLDSAPLEQVIVTTTTTLKPSTSISVTKEGAPRSLLEKENLNNGTEVPLHHGHEHIEENLEGHNGAMENITMYLGIALLVAVVGIVAFVVVTRRMKRKRKNNNRRFET